MTAMFSWNLIADIRDMWTQPFMVNAFRAGTIVAVLAALIGWFMVLRRQSFAGHTLAVVGFPGAAAATLAGVSISYGYFGACVAAAIVIAVIPRGTSSGYTEESAVIGTVQAFSLATGMLFIALYGGFLNGTNALLFGSFLGISTPQITSLFIAAIAVIAVLAVVGRPLLFSSVDSQVARAHGVPTRRLDTTFLILLGVTAAEVSQITGALLVFALLVLPAATAQIITARPSVSLCLSVGLALLTVWIALFIAYYSPYPIGFWLTTIGFAGYALTYAVHLASLRLGRRVRTVAAVAG
jgi:zinc/manganese transport system permease protein